MTGKSAKIQKLLNQAMDLHQSGNLKQAGALYRTLLQKDPTHADALHLLGGIMGQMGKHEAAITLISSAITQKPGVALFRSNLAMVLIAADGHREALKAADEALAIEPHLAEAYNHKGIALHHLGRLEEAVVCYRKALESKPSFANAYNNMGNAFKKLGDSQQAALCYEKALELQPNSLEAARNLAVVHLFNNSSTEAENILNSLQNSDDSEVDNLLGQVNQLQGKTREARDYYSRALKKCPDNPLWQLRLHAACPVIIPNRETIDEWRAQFLEAAQAMAPIDLTQHAESLAASHAEPPYHLAYQGEDNLHLKKTWAGLFTNSDNACSQPSSRGPVRIGILVTPGHEGIFLKCTRGILERWGVTGAVLTLLGPPGSLQLIQKRVNNPKIKYRPMLPGFKATVDHIRRQKFHLIYFWEVGSDALNYFLPFFRLAPVQCTSWGTSDTTGAPNIDYYLSSKQWETMDAQTHYSEKLKLLDRVPTCFHPPTPAGQANLSAFGFNPGEHLYFCAQNLFKIHPDFDRLLKAIISRDPLARILLVEGKQNHWTTLLKARLEQNLTSAFKQVSFLNRLNYNDYLSLVTGADVLLDSLHFSGGNTSYEGLGLGAPIVTLPGAFIRGRFTLGCYRLMGLTQCVATDEADYVERATRLACDPHFRDNAVGEIREARDRLFLDETAAHEFETMLATLAAG